MYRSYTWLKGKFVLHACVVFRQGKEWEALTNNFDKHRKVWLQCYCYFQKSLPSKRSYFKYTRSVVYVQHCNERISNIKMVTYLDADELSEFANQSQRLAYVYRMLTHWLPPPVRSTILLFLTDISGSSAKRVNNSLIVSAGKPDRSLFSSPRTRSPVCVVEFCVIAVS